MTNILDVAKRRPPTVRHPEGEPKRKSESRFEMKLPTQLKEQAQNRADELGISLAEYVKSLMKQDILRNSDAMSFEEAVEIYIEHFDDGNGSVIQLDINDSYLKGGIWYLRNVNGHLARVGTKCGCVLPDLTRNPVY